MKRKNKEIGLCCWCGLETSKQVPRHKGFPNSNKPRFYCGCKGIMAV